MTPATPHSPGAKLLGDLRRELSEVERQIRSHRFLVALDEGRVPRERLAAFAGEQQAIISSDRRSFALLAARFPEPPAGDLSSRLPRARDGRSSCCAPSPPPSERTRRGCAHTSPSPALGRTRRSSPGLH